MDLVDTKVDRKGLLTAKEAVDAAGGVSAVMAPRRDRGIEVPWRWANAVLAGLHPEQLVIVGAHTSIGKTSWALQVAAHACRQKRRGAIFSLEMSNQEVIERMVTQMSGVEPEGRRDTPMGEADRRLRLDALAEIMSWGLWFDDVPGHTTASVHAGLRKLANRHGQIDFVIVDHLHLLGAAGRMESRTQEVSYCSRSLKLMAKEFRCCMVVPAQLSRDQDKRADLEPTLTALRQSGEIEQNANVVVFLHVPRCANQDFKPAKLIVAKQRNGPRDVWTESFAFRPKVQCFVETEDVAE